MTEKTVTMLVCPDETPVHDRPVIFLAGPIQGASDWQGRVPDYISWDGSDILVANPRRPGPFTPDTFQEQVDWEQKHLGWALTYGVVLFWLPFQDRPRDSDGTYAQTTRFELGYIIGQLRKTIKWGLAGYCPLVVGAEEDFHGRHYIEYMLNKEFLGRVSMRKTLEETVDAATGILSLLLSEP